MSGRLDANELQRFVRNYQRILASRSSLGETDTRNAIVNPFLMTIGWSFVPDEIESEFGVQVGSGKSRVDYCLKANGGPVAFLEAKPLGTALTDDQFQQALSYGRVAFVRWCMLTNGKDWIVLDANARSSNPKDAEIFRFNLATIEEVPRYLEALSPHGMATNLLEEVANEVAKRKAVIARFAKQHPQMAKEIAAQLAPFVADSRATELTTRFLAGVQAEIEAGQSPREATPVQQESRLPPSPTEFRTTTRARLPDRGKNLIAIFPAREDGIPFVKLHKAWGQVFIARKPDYVALYVTRPRQQIRLIAPVRSMSKVPDWLAKTGISDPFDPRGNPDKMVIEFDGDALELEDPIAWKQGDPNIQGLRYTTLEGFRKATHVGDLELADLSKF